MSFSQIKPALSPTTLESVAALGFTHMTPVQQATIPRFLSHRDVAVEACTGSGKTLAFVIPVVELLLRRRSNEGSRRRPTQWGAIVLSPTRELARQIYSVAKYFAQGAALQIALFTGGTEVQNDIQRLRCAADGQDEGAVDIVVATPGRLHDLLERSKSNGTSVDLRELEVLVLDEADVLLDMGFERVVSNILSRLPKQRRTGLFSATQTGEVRALIRAGLRNPASIAVKVNAAPKPIEQGGGCNEITTVVSACTTTQRTPATLRNFYFTCESDEKLSYLIRFLTSSGGGRKSIVFCATCACVDFFSHLLDELLNKAGSRFPVWSLHGRMVTKRRTLTFETFVAAQEGVLLCTDVAARGLDVPRVDWIVQYDPPQDPDFFVHRVGRTARAGRSGSALIFLLPNEDAYIHFLANRNVPITPCSPELLDKHCDDRTTLSPTSVLSQVRNLIFHDRALLEKGTRAFVSFVRSYKEHQCQFIFRFADLDLLRLAHAFVLLRLPNMSELRGSSVLKRFEEVPAARVLQIRFKDKQRERQRQQRFATATTAKTLLKAREQKEQQVRSSVPQPPTKRRKKGKQRAIFEEWDELANEERLYKKYKQGKLTKAEYERELTSRMAATENDLILDSSVHVGEDDEDEHEEYKATPRHGTHKSKYTKVKWKKNKKRSYSSCT